MSNRDHDDNDHHDDDDEDDDDGADNDDGDDIDDDDDNDNDDYGNEVCCGTNCQLWESPTKSLTKSAASSYFHHLHDNVDHYLDAGQDDELNNDL